MQPGAGQYAYHGDCPQDTRMPRKDGSTRQSIEARQNSQHEQAQQGTHRAYQKFSGVGKCA